MQTGVSLDAERTAAAIAPIIDRIRMAAVAAVRPLEEEAAERAGVPAPVLRPLGMLRNTMPDRVVTIADLLEVFVYQPPAPILAAVDGLVAADILETAGEGAIRLANLGQALVNEVLGRMRSVTDELWSGHAGLVAELVPLAQRAAAGVLETGGVATRVMAPPYDFPGASPALKLAEALTPLRFHRADAHVAAWRAEGLTVDQIQQLGAGPQRDRIEAATNTGAAAPYAVLTPDERFTLCAGLGALPN